MLRKMNAGGLRKMIYPDTAPAGRPAAGREGPAMLRRYLQTLGQNGVLMADHGE